MAEHRALIIGGNGRLGASLVRLWAARGVTMQSTSRDLLDLRQPEQVDAVLRQLNFDLLVNTAGAVDVDKCEAMGSELEVVNVEAPAAMAAHCAERGARMVQISTDYVFSGEQSGLLKEEEPPLPLNAYGHSKLASEKAVLAAHPDALVARVSWLFGGHKGSFPDRILREAKLGPVSAVNDKWACPTYADDLCQWLYHWCFEQQWQSGLLHLCNSGSASWADYGQEVLAIGHRLGLPLKAERIAGHSMDGFPPFVAARPRHTVLGTQRFRSVTGITPRPWQEALEEYLRSTLT